MNQKILEIFDSLAFQLVVLDESESVDIETALSQINELTGLTGKFPYFEKCLSAVTEILEEWRSGADPLSRQADLLTLLELLRSSLRELEKLAPRKKPVLSSDLTDRIEAYFAAKAEEGAQNSQPSQEVQNASFAEQIEVLQQIVSSEFYDFFSKESESRLMESQNLTLELYENFDRKKVNEIFRIFHTLKGECGFINLEKVGSLTHQIENLLDAIRNNKVKYSAEVTDILILSQDTVRNLINALNAREFRTYIVLDTDKITARIKSMVDRGYPPIGEILLEEKKLTKKELEKVIEAQQENDFQNKLGEIVVETGKVTEADVEEALEKQREIIRKTSSTKKDPIVSVYASQIDLISDLIQELWIAESQIENENIHQIQKITSQIQHVAMDLRTIKVQQLYMKMKMVVRNLDKKLAKNIGVTFEGHDLEIDRNLVESLEEVVMHLLRNSYDHGIESPDERKAAGKPERGSVHVKAERKGNRIIVSIQDDGQGLNREKIIKRAIERNLITQSDVRNMSNTKVFELIMAPGFSTAVEVSDISGRGMGLDIIQTMVNSYHGRLNIDSEEGKFTLFELSFPLHTAIVDGLIVESHENLYAIPIADVVNCSQIEEDQIHNAQNGINLLKARGELIPIVDLADALFVTKTSMQDSAQLSSERKAAVIVKHEKMSVALQVDRIIEKKEIVIKPLGKKFNNLKGISSGTVFSGGKIGYILDVDELVRKDEKRLQEAMPILKREQVNGE